MRLTAFAVAVVTAAAVGLSACGGDDNGKLEEKTLKFTEKETPNFGFADNPPKTKQGPEGPQELSNGDQFTFSSELLDGSKKDVGEINATCAVVRPGNFETAHFQCVGTAIASGGSLTLAVGGRFNDKLTRGAVVGGTGSYLGATGEFTSAQSRPDQSEDTFHIFVPEK